MALTQKQKAAIADQARKNIAKRAATQRTKISASEARTVSNKMNKRPGAMKGFTLKDSSLLSKNEKNTLGATSKANAAKEKFLQKNRNFAKGTGKLAVKDRVGTKAEYKQLGKDIETRKQLIASSKTARASQAARAANPAPAPTTLTKAVTPVATKKKTPTPKIKPSTAAIKERTVPNTKATTPKASTKPKLQTLDQAKASAPKPRGPMLGPEKPTTTLTKPASMEYMSKTPASALSKPTGKIASKVSDVKKAASSTKVGNVVKAAAKTTAAKSVASKASSVAAKVGNSKLVKGAKFAAKVGVAVGAAKEANQIVSGQAEKDFRRIQALENRIAIAKGQKPKYTTTGTNKNLLSSVKTDLGVSAKILSNGLVGKDRKDRLAELAKLAAKAEKNKPAIKLAAKPAAKPAAGSKPAAISGNKYRVNAGDTLSGIASRAGVSLKDLRASNPKITDPRKIYRNTPISIPKSGKVPSGGYTKKVN